MIEIIQTIGAIWALTASIAIGFWRGGVWVKNRLIPNITIKSGICNPPLLPQDKNYGHPENEAMNWIQGTKDRWSFMREQRVKDKFILYLSDEVFLEKVIFSTEKTRHPSKVKLNWQDNNGKWITAESKDWQEERIEFSLSPAPFTSGIQLEILETTKEESGWALYAIRIYYKKGLFHREVKVGKTK